MLEGSSLQIFPELPVIHFLDVLLKVRVPQVVSSVSCPPVGVDVSKYVEDVGEVSVIVYLAFPVRGELEKGKFGIDALSYEPNMVYCLSSQLANSDRSATASARFDLITKLRYEGSAIDAKKATMATTIISSIRVNPIDFFLRVCIIILIRAVIRFGLVRLFALV